MSKFIHYKQLDARDCGPVCIQMIAKHYGCYFSLDYLREKCHLSKIGVSFADIAATAEAIGLSTLPVRIDFSKLEKEALLPCIVHVDQNHFVVVYKISRQYVYIADPAIGLLKYTKEEFCKKWQYDDKKGAVLLLEPNKYFLEQDREVGQVQYTKGLWVLLRYFKPYKKPIRQILLGLSMMSLLILTFPFLTQSIIDKGIFFQDKNFIFIILIAQIMLYTSQISIEFIRNWILLFVTEKVNIRFISDFFSKLLKLPIRFFDSKNTGDFLQRTDDHDRVNDFISVEFIEFVFSVLTGFIFAAVLFYYDPIIFIIFLLGSALYIIWLQLFMKRRMMLDHLRFDILSKEQLCRIQMIHAIQEIKLNNSEKKRRWEWENLQVRLFRYSMKLLKTENMQSIGGEFIDQIKNLTITFYAALLVIDGSLSLGSMLAIQFIIGQLNVPIANLLGFMKNYQDAKLSINRLNEIHIQEEENENDTLKILDKSSFVEIKNLWFRYGGVSSPYVLSDINFSIPKDKVTAIVGASGSGKTTLIKLLLKLYEPTKGQINIGKNDLYNYNATYWRSLCGAVMQDGYIFADSIVRNIMESSDNDTINKTKLIHSVEMAELKSFIASLPAGYYTQIGENGISLSGGQNQRILIARAVYKDPKFLFFDEATSSLDAKNENRIMKNMEEFYKNKTVIIIAHRLSTVKNANQIIVLDEGKLVEKGDHRSLTRKKGVYFTLIRNQLELGQ